MLTKTVNGITTEIEAPVATSSGTEYKIVDGTYERIWGADNEAEYLAAKEISDQKATDKASAKAKLIAGEALTEAEADTIVL